MEIKSKVVMIPSKKAQIGDLYLTSQRNTLARCDYGTLHLAYGNVRHIYFLSNEEIKEGDWVRNSIGNMVRADIEDVAQGYPKIIASTDETLGLPKPSASFIEVYVKAHNEQRPITEVMIESDEYATVKEDTDWIYKGLTLKVNSTYIEHNKFNPEYGRNLRLSLLGTGFEGKHRDSDTVIWEKDLIMSYKLKVDKNNEITIHKVKDSWNREEHCTDMQYYMEYVQANGYVTPMDWLDKFKHY